jgi:hypothetical protein
MYWLRGGNTFIFNKLAEISQNIFTLSLWGILCKCWDNCLIKSFLNSGCNNKIWNKSRGMNTFLKALYMVCDMWLAGSECSAFCRWMALPGCVQKVCIGKRVETENEKGVFLLDYWTEHYPCYHKALSIVCLLSVYELSVWMSFLSEWAFCLCMSLLSVYELTVCVWASLASSSYRGVKGQAEVRICHPRGVKCFSGTVCVSKRTTTAPPPPPTFSCLALTWRPSLDPEGVSSRD